MNITVLDNVPAPMRDGTVLRADVFLPEGNGPFPTTLIRTPYNKSRERDVLRYRGLAEKGFAVVVQDTRGRYRSDGIFRPMFGAEFDDPEDGYDTVEWAAAQDWSSGKVGTFGNSYASWTQWQLAPLMPPHLVTMFTGGMGPKTTDWEIGGVFRPGRALQWLLGTIAPDTQGWLDDPAGPTDPDSFDRLAAVATREKWLWSLPYADLPLEALGGLREHFRDWLENHHEDRFGIVGNFSKIDLPVHHRTGWYDRLIATTRMFTHMVNEAPTEETRRNQQLLIGPWTHTSDFTRKTGELDFGPEAEADWVDLASRWFDYWLKGEQNGVMDGPPVKLFTMGVNRWRQEEEWPPAGAVMTDFFFYSQGSANTPSGDGSLSQEPPGPMGTLGEERPDSYVYDPRDPLMTLFLANGHDGPFDQRYNAHRRDVLTYQSEVLTAQVEVTGYPVLHLFATSDAPDTDFMVRLIDVHPDGFAQNLCYGFQRARFRAGLDRPPELMRPGEVYQFEIELAPTSNVFLPGHRIRVDISSSDFPNHDRNHNTGGNDYFETEMRTARQTVFHDPARPSRIVLPVTK